MKFDPDWCIAPGVHLAEIMKSWGLSSRMVAKVAGVEPAVIEGVLLGTEKITPSMSAGLATMGVSAGFWSNLQEGYDRAKAVGKTDLTADYDTDDLDA